MKEFIDKLIERLEELKKKDVCDRILCIECHEKYGDCDNALPFLAYDNAISIVNKLAEEYKGGWIPCSERFPEEQDEYLVTWIPEYFSKKCFCEIVEYSPEEGWIGKIPQAPFGKYTIIAWQPLPQLYREGE